MATGETVVQLRNIAVIGLGYVGLPVAVAFARSGAAVVGFDIDRERIGELCGGFDRTHEVEKSQLAQPTLVYTAAYAGDITFVGTNYTYNRLTNQPLWNIFGYQNSQGQPADPGGFFDLVAVVSTAATTGAAGDLFVRVSYVV